MGSLLGTAWRGLIRCGDYCGECAEIVRSDWWPGSVAYGISEGICDGWRACGLVAIMSTPGGRWWP